MDNLEGDDIWKNTLLMICQPSIISIYIQICSMSFIGNFFIIFLNYEIISHRLDLTL